MTKVRPPGRNGKENEQTELLRGIWNEMKAVRTSLKAELSETRRELSDRIDVTNVRLDEMRGDLTRRIDATNSRLDELRDDLTSRLRDSELRLATATMELAGDVRGLAFV